MSISFDRQEEVYTGGNGCVQVRRDKMIMYLASISAYK